MIFNPDEWTSATCGQCGITYLIPKPYWLERVRTETPLYCPNGHVGKPIDYTKPRAAEKTDG